VGGRRSEAELVAVPMDAQQEIVYGWLGLNPVLLLDPAPGGDNLVVRIVRPGDDADAVLEEARQQLAASGSRRRRRGRGAPGEVRSGAPAGGDPYAAGDPSPAWESASSGETMPSGEPFFNGEGQRPLTPVTITPLSPFGADDAASPSEVLTVAVPVQRRTRSSATASGASTAPVAAASAGTATLEAELAAADAGSADPRRRRRRSSASV
jgi:ribonuclease E